MEQLFDHFANLPALNQEKEQVLRIFQDIEDAVARMGRQGVTLDTSRSVTETAAAVRQYEQIQRQLEAAQQRLAATLQQINQLQAQSAQGTQAQTQAYQGLNAAVDATAQKQLQLKQQLEQVKQAIKDIQTLQSSAGNSSALTQQLVELTKQEQALKLEIQQNTRYFKNQTQEMISQEGSLDSLRAKLNQLLQEYDKMSAEVQQTDVGKQKLETIQQITASLNEQEQSQGRYFRNVGNYANSLSPLFKSLSDEISNLKTKQQGLQDLSQRNPVGFQLGGGPQELAQTTAALEQLEQVQQIGFKTTGSFTQQINTMRESLQSLEGEGKQSTQFLDSFKTKLQSIISSAKPTAFSGAFGTIQQELAKVKQALQDPALSGAQLEKLQNEERLLAQLTDNLSQVFNSSRQELRAYMEASVQMGVAFGDTDARVLAFQEAVGAATNEVDDLKRTIKFQASDTKFIDGAISAVHGLAGAYSVAQGAAQLFADNDADLQKSMVKLQALMTVTTGLQAVMNAVQTESGAIQTALAAKMAIVNAAKAIQAKLQVAVTTSSEAEAVAATEAATANEGLAVSNAEVGASATGAAAAEETMAVATEAATAATTGLGTALLASGIGIAIAAIAVAAYYGVKAFSDWLDTASRTLKMEKDLRDATDEMNKALIDQAAIVGENDKGLQRFYQTQLENAQKSGKDQYQIFALRKQLAQEESNLANNNIERLGASYTAEKQLASKLEDLNIKKMKLLDDYSAAITSHNKEDMEASKGALDIFKDEYDKTKTQYDSVSKALRDRETANKDSAQIDIEQAKFAADERRKLVLAEAQNEVDYIQAKNNAVLSSDRSTLQQRLAAIKSNAAAQKQAAEAERNSVLSDPSSTFATRLMAIEKAAESEKKINIATKQELFRTSEDYRLRDLGANEDMLKRKLQMEIDTNKAIADSQVFTLGQRLKALQDYSDAQKASDQADYKLALQRAGLSDEDAQRFMKDNSVKITNKKVTDAELLAIASQNNSKLLQDDQDRSLKSLDILQSEADKQKQIREKAVKSIQDVNKGMTLKSSSDFVFDMSKANAQFAAGKISYENYQEQVLQITAKYNKAKLDANTQEQQQELVIYKDAEEKLLKAQAQLANAKDAAETNSDPLRAKELAKSVEEAQHEVDIAQDAADKKHDIEQKLQDQRAQMLNEYVNKAKELEDQLSQAKMTLLKDSLEAAQQVGDGLFDQQKQAVQDQIDSLDALTQAQIEAANNIVEAETKKQARIKAINAEANKEKAKLTEEQKKIDHDKAVFDKIIKGVEIASDTTAAVAKITLTVAELTALAATNPLLATLIPVAAAQIPIALAIGAVQEAALLATPIPGYWTGTMHSKEGTANVAELGRELAIDPSGKIVMYDKPQMAYLTEGTKILPNSVTEQIIAAAAQDQDRLLGLYGAKQAPTINVDTRAEDILKELRELNKKSRIVINNQLGIESTPYYQQQMKK